MALSGIQIYKLLPQTNCQECGYPTCLAFAMKLAAKQADLDDCPYVSDEAKEKLAESSAPPIRLVTLSANGRKAEAGNEIVLFRHEKRFFNPAGIFIRVYDDEPLDEIKKETEAAMSYAVEYVGMDLVLDGMAVQATGSGDDFAAAVGAVLETAQVPLILIADDPDVMAKGLEAAGDTKPLIYGATADHWEPFAELAKQHGTPMAVRAETMSELADVSNKLKESGVDRFVLDPGVRDLRSSLALNTLIRRLAIDKTFRPLGFPLINFPSECVDDPGMVPVAATQAITKYAGFVVIDDFSPGTIRDRIPRRWSQRTSPSPTSLWRMRSMAAVSPLGSWWRKRRE